MSTPPKSSKKSTSKTAPVPSKASVAKTTKKPAHAKAAPSPVKNKAAAAPVAKKPEVGKKQAAVKKPSEPKKSAVVKIKENKSIAPSKSVISKKEESKPTTPKKPVVAKEEVAKPVKAAKVPAKVETKVADEKKAEPTVSAAKPAPAKAKPVAAEATAPAVKTPVVAAKVTSPAKAPAIDLTASPVGNPLPNGGHSPAFVDKQRQRLLDLRDELVDAMSGMTRDTIRNAPEGSEASGSGMHQGDAGSDAYDRDFALSVLAKEQDALYEIEEALKRIRKNTYGICELSGKKIPHTRLEAIPFARLTVECQAQWEKEYGNRRFRPSNQVGFSGGQYEEDDDSETVSLDEDDD